MRPIGLAKPVLASGYSIRSSYSLNRSFGVTRDITKPTGLTEGDLLVMVLWGRPIDGTQGYSLAGSGWGSSITEWDFAYEDDGTPYYNSNCTVIWKKITAGDIAAANLGTVTNIDFVVAAVQGWGGATPTVVFKSYNTDTGTSVTTAGYSPAGGTKFALGVCQNTNATGPTAATNGFALDVVATHSDRKQIISLNPSYTPNVSAGYTGMSGSTMKFACLLEVR